MRRDHLALLLAACALASGCERSAPSTSPTPSSQPAVQAPAPPSAPKASAQAETLAGLPFVEVVTGGASQADALPVVFALHGLGDRPEAFARLFVGLPVKARVIALRAIEPYSSGFSWFRFQGVSDDERAEGIREAARVVAKAMREVREKRPVVGKPIVTGFSQGGMLSFELGVNHPSEVGAAFPISGYLPPRLIPESNTTPDRPRIEALHGEDDARLPIEPTRVEVERLQKLSVPVRLREYPGVGHSVSAEMRQDLFSLLSEAVGRAAQTQEKQ